MKPEISAEKKGQALMLEQKHELRVRNSGVIDKVF